MFFMGKVANHLFQNSLDQKTAKSLWHCPVDFVENWLQPVKT